MRCIEFLNKKISVLGFGGIPIMSENRGNFLVKGSCSDYASSIKVIEHALDCGINFFDTAVDYGDSEQKIGDALNGSRANVFLASKSKALYYDDMMKSVEQSLKRLKTDYIDLYQFHYVKDPKSYEIITSDKGALKALIELKNSGVIRFIGIASHNASVLENGMDCSFIDTLQLPYNIIENENINLINKASSIGIPTIIMKPYAGGSLTQVNKRVADIISDENQLRRLALKFILKESISVVIPGMRSIEEVDENVNIVNEKFSISKNEYAIINKLKERIGTVFCRRCQYCEPCPMGVPISQILRYDKYYTDYGLEEWAKEQYNSLEKNASQCIQCGKCESKCPYNLKIIDTIKIIHKKMIFT